MAEFERSTSGAEEGALKQLPPPNECISSEPATKCKTTAVGLNEVSGLALSSDGKNLYAAATGSGGSSGGDIAEFERHTSGSEEGALTQLSGSNACLTSTGVTGCASALDINGSGELIVSPDGKNVYANSFVENAILEFSRESSGELKQLAGPNTCISSSATTPSGCTAVKGIEESFGMAISPDGSDLYATGIADNAVAAFERSASGGALTQFAAPYECITENASGCGTNEAVGLKEAWLPVIGPDGANVYVGGAHGQLVELARTVKPTVARVNHPYGPSGGGAEVFIKGSGFAEGATVLFDGTPSPDVTVNSASSIKAISPPGAEGAVELKVENGAGASAEVNTFTFTDKPAVVGVTPSIGTEAGGTVVTIAGSEFLAGASVDFGTSPASNVTVNSAESITATSPPGTDTMDVTVTTADGTSKVGAADKFTYVDGSPSPPGGLFLQGYCEGAGYQRVTLEKNEEVGGPGFAYENWACVESDGTEVAIANTGPAPSMTNACEVGNNGEASYAYPTEPNSAYSWECYTVVPSGEKNGSPPGENKSPSGGGSSNEPTAKAASLLTPIISVPPLVVPPPVLAHTGNVAPVSGTVLVKVPGTSRFVPLSTLQQIPFGSVIEATHGTVSVTTAEPGGKTQTGEFFEGEFILRQGPNGIVIAELTGGNFSVCPTKRERSHIARAASAPASAASASGSHVVRKLWANAHGKFSTKGNYAAGAVQGTEWLTEDLCDGTYIKVTRDKVAVTNLVNHRHVEVTTGHHYLAKAP